MAYGEKQMSFTVCDGVNVVTQEMEFGGKVMTVEVRISEKYGFVRTVVTDHQTGQEVDLDMQLNDTKNLEFALTSSDDVFGKLTEEGFENEQ